MEQLISELKQQVETLNLELLSQEDGISEGAFWTLDYVNYLVLGHDRAVELCNKADATDGRFYYPVEEEEVELYDDLAD